VADLESIVFTPYVEAVEDSGVKWAPDGLQRVVDRLPQIFWSGGEPWHEANHWAATRVATYSDGKLKTIARLMEHLVRYAKWLEREKLDWRHFPIRKQHRALVLYRAALIKARDAGELAPSTATAGMRAVIQFYRHCHAHGLVDTVTPMWKDNQVVIRLFDAAGFVRTITRVSSELAIKNQSRPGLRVEDGLTPLTIEHATRVLEFSRDHCQEELHLMLSIGVLVGPRIGTITSLGVKNIENAYPDPQTPDTYRVRVGPGTGVSTKFNVSGELLMPRFLREKLLSYASSTRRLIRQDRAAQEDRDCLFLTSSGKRYGKNSINPLMSDLRACGVAAGLQFMERFKFHQTRATFGTILMDVALKVTSAKAAIAFVRDAMLHKHERTTFLYIRFLEEAPIKAEVSNQFTASFSGVVNRNWNDYDA
jgi:integrase